MSLDGSFSCDSALRRLLARCPALRSDPRLLSLSHTDRAVTADEVVEAIADPFLHPNYTIPIMGCFRPLCQRIVERVISKLKVVPNLDSENENDEERDEIGEEDVRVVDFYVGRGRGLRLHELASLAFVRALDLAPFLLGFLLSYYRISPPPFRRLVSVMNLASEFKDKSHLLEAVRVTYRFLVIETKIFSELWEWTCFFDLMRQPDILNFSSTKMALDNILDIKWCSSQILSVVLKISDRAVEKFGLGPDETLSCLLRWEDFCQDITLEKAGWYLDENNADNGNCCDGDFKFDCFLEFNSSMSSIVSSRSHKFKSEGRNCRSKVSSVSQLAGGPFFLTSVMRKSFDMCLMAVSQKWPILLHGPAGAGKTSLVWKLAEICEKQVLFIHVDEQMDSKTLVGSYICTEVPGEFKWQPGSLTQAILNGCWVVFEDLDKAPNDVKAIILPLLEGSGSFATGHGEVLSSDSVDVPESFCLFATMTTSKHDAWHAIEGSSVWRKVMVGAPSKGDLVEIVNECYPSLATFSVKLIKTFERVNSISSNILVGGVASTGFFSRFLLRDLLKWCRRITGLGVNISGPAIPPHLCRSIFQEAVDIFASSLPSLDNRLLIRRELAHIWNIPVPDADSLCSSKPFFETSRSSIQVGRVVLERNQPVVVGEKRYFVGIRSSLQVLEKIACSVKYNEPVLLVGETGTGKTTLVQSLATKLGHSLTVMNLSQQSDVADLLGGYKPTDARSICMPIYHELKELFCKSFSRKANENFLHRCEMYVMEKNWKKLLHACQKVVNFARNRVGTSSSPISGSKRKRPISEEVFHNWDSFASRLDAVRKQISSSVGMLFSFVEGSFVTAIKNGHWILLDEVNLAPPEMLQRIIGVLDGEKGTICLTERGDVDCIERHPDFRIFACMNPATDAGKRELPFSFRSRFTEYFVDDVLDDEDLALFISQYIGDSKSEGELSMRIVSFYKAAKRESEERLQDSANQKPQFSLRSLARALEYSKKAEKDFVFQKALYDGFCMFFLTLLDSPSAKIMNNMILSYLLGGNVPPNIPFDSYFIRKTQHQHIPNMDSFVENYILTKSVKEHLRNLSRAIYTRKYPVLLQGPTSSGKTSLVRYLASVTGHEFVRINNHEHTDLQEYFGSYVTDSCGRLQFQEGVLVKAVRRGHWIVLDELNLAPSDLLEALNRLLDDNRELFVPELQETVSAHPEFMLFATQNPPTVYGGRKVLSRAFRNRFLEVHVDEIPEDELTTIIEKRCKIPESYALKMIDVMKDLQLHRQKSKIFAGKQGFITPRDLFRWANRFRVFGKSYEDLGKDGYLLLAERLRDDSEKTVVRETLERRLRVKLCMDDLYKWELGLGDCALQFPKRQGILANVGNVTWTESMWRLYFLVERCYKMREPVLLVGETGGGKTTVCQMLSAVLGSRLHILNCHQYTETSDFIGGFYPVRDRSKLTMEFKQLIGRLKHSRIYLNFSEDDVISSDITQASTLNVLDEIMSRYRNHASLDPDITQQDIDGFEKIKLELTQLQQKWQTIFLWQDGPLVQAMKCGDLFLVDEISLADDSVLERLNSVLEPERALSLPEKGGSEMEKVTGHPDFFLLATMNPGGDYGKKELSPALRNRFTEVWVPPVRDKEELIKIASGSFTKSELSCFADCIVMFWEWFNQSQTCRTLTVRDLLSWVSFMNVTEGSLGSQYAFIHGAFLVVLDGLSLGTGMSKSDANRLRQTSLSFLLNVLKGCVGCINLAISKMENYGWGDEKHGDLSHVNGFHLENLFGVHPFYINKGPNDCRQEGFQFLAPTTRRNALRVLRAMQLPKPVLLEGSPGVGKTSLVTALAAYSGHSVVRINLSEQTDMMDLLGSDLPVEGESGMEFSWSDGVLLQALKNGNWVLLDELNLAPQSVLEGLMLF
ncbi:putative cobaltochelatase [Dioscorea sansibarensis]